MKYTITHTCGHTSELQLFGPGRERDYARARAKERPCPACLRRTGQERAAAQQEEWGLPPLSGSDKQIAWAMTLRHQTLITIERVLAETSIDRDAPRPVPAPLAMGDGETYTINGLLAELVAHDTARWWIDHTRDVTRKRNQWTDPFAPSDEEFVRQLLAGLLGDRPRTTEELLASPNPLDWIKAIF